MTYAIVWLDGETTVGTSFNEDFLAAVSNAKEKFPIKAQRLGATAVEVRDQAGKCLMRHAVLVEPGDPEPRQRFRLRFKRREGT